MATHQIGYYDKISICMQGKFNLRKITERFVYHHFHSTVLWNGMIDVNIGKQTRTFPLQPIPKPTHHDNTSAFRGTSLTKPYFLPPCGHVSTSNLIWEREHSRNN